MEAGLIWIILATAVSVGIGCGTCCSPVISMFLSSYVISHADGAKKGFRSFGLFFFGKLISVTLLCVASVVVGRQFIGEDGFIGSLNLRLAVQVIMSGIGLFMAVRWFLENGNKNPAVDVEGMLKKRERQGIGQYFWRDSPMDAHLMHYCF